MIRISATTFEEAVFMAEACGHLADVSRTVDGKQIAVLGFFQMISVMEKLAQTPEQYEEVRRAQTEVRKYTNVLW